MSFGGHAAAMVSSLKNNRSLLRRKSNKEKNRDAFANLASKRKKSKKLRHKKATEEELNHIHSLINEDRLKNRKKIFLTILISAFIAILMFYLFKTYAIQAILEVLQ